MVKMIKIKFQDGSSKEYKPGISSLEIAKERKVHAVAVRINSVLADLKTEIKEGAELEFIGFDSAEGKGVFWHTASHILAQAVMRLFPDARLTIGPAVEEGFYYDIEHEPFTPDDLEKIEAEMRKIVKENLKIERMELTRERAEELFRGNRYKMEMVDEFGENLTAYRQAEFIDLCRGPHLPSTGMVKGLKLTKLSSAYWRGSPENPQLQRIYGIAFPDEQQMKDWLHLKEEAEKRDHRKLGKQLDLFSVHDTIGQGLPLYHPRGAAIRKLMTEFIREQNEKLGYKEVWTPHIARSHLWKQSGHYDAYREKMYIFQSENEEHAIKPMNCPFHSYIYKSRARSYRDLPIGYSEFATVYRLEQSGEVSGILRVRALTQDDGHMYLRPDQIKEEIVKVVRIAIETIKAFGINEFKIHFSTRPDKAIGEIEVWHQAETALKSALESANIEYILKEGEGAFYGPKIDIDIKDALGRYWQCSTIQLDFFMPERFDLVYMGEDGVYHRPVMIHRALVGTLDRFLGILIEHYAGRFPLWLAPVQLRVITVADRFIEYAKVVEKELGENGLRVDTDYRAESIPKKVRECQLEQIPIIVTVGEKEESNRTVAVRTLDGKVVFGMKVPELIERAGKLVKEKSVKTVI